MRTLFRIRAVIAASVLAPLTAMAQSGVNASPPASVNPPPPPPPPIMREFRAAWVASVSSIDWPSRPGLSSWEQKAELIAMLNQAVKLNLNAVILQVRPAADALYDSPLEPWSEYLTGEQGRPPEPYYDPLAFAVEEAHARGLELHAWFNPYRARHPSARGSEATTHISRTNPELVKTYGDFLWMDPGEPAVRERTLRVMTDVARRYDVDGVHIDDYFYPYPIRDTVAGADIPFPDSASYARYQDNGGQMERDDWRRHNVDTLIAELYTRVKAVKPHVMVGISPFGIWRPGTPPSIAGFDAYARLYADARRWLREGWLDYVTPQLYWPVAQTPQSYPVLLEWWAGENVMDRHYWPGNFTSRAASLATGWTPSELREQIRLTRAHPGSTGNVHFSMRALMPRAAGDTLPNVANDLLTGPYADPALVPATPWLGDERPPPPVVTVRPSDATGGRILVLDENNEQRPWRWTVRVRSGGAWSTSVLPGAQKTLTISSGSQPVPDEVVITAVNRTGIESQTAIYRPI